MKTKNADRWRCLMTGCNPQLFGESAATAHKNETGHRVAKWPVRSPEGERRAQIRNQTGYYDKYNVGPKSPEARLGTKRRKSEKFDTGSVQDISALSTCPYQEVGEWHGDGFPPSPTDCGECSWCAENSSPVHVYESFEDGYGEGF